MWHLGITFPQALLGSDNFSDFPCVWRSPGSLFCGTSLSWRLSAILFKIRVELQAFDGATEVKHHCHHSMLRGHTIKMTHKWFRDDVVLNHLLRQDLSDLHTVRLLFSLLSTLHSLEGSHYAQPTLGAWGRGRRWWSTSPRVECIHNSFEFFHRGDRPLLSDLLIYSTFILISMNL